jgi:hypothetical protein
MSSHRKSLFGRSLFRVQEDAILHKDLTQARLLRRIIHLILKPTWKSFPAALLLVCVLGALPAPALALFFGWILDIRWEQVFREPRKMIPSACIGGACQALCAWLLCILPFEHLRPYLRRYPRSVTYGMVFGSAMLASSAGWLLASSSAANSLVGARLLAGRQPSGRLAALSVLTVISSSLLMVVVRSILADGEIRERALAEAAALAKAHALQSQINPHFFFNTLTTVSALAELDSRAAKELVGQLAQLFRYTLSCSQLELVTVEQELEFVSNYLLIEQARFRRRLTFELPPPEAGRGILVPGLTLQPLVENAVRHGIAKRREGGVIKVGLEQRESFCMLTVANQISLEDLPPLRADQVFLPGHSLTNTRDRLALVFHGQASLTFAEDASGWVKVVLRLPLQKVQ